MEGWETGGKSAEGRGNMPCAILCLSVIGLSLRPMTDKHNIAQLLFASSERNVCNLLKGIEECDGKRGNVHAPGVSLCIRTTKQFL